MSSLSVTTPTDTFSPLSPLSPSHSVGSPGNAAMVLPGMPNLRDEDGNPINSQQHLQQYQEKQLEKGRQQQMLYQQKLQQEEEEEQREREQHEREQQNQVLQKQQKEEANNDTHIYAVPIKKRKTGPVVDSLPNQQDLPSSHALPNHQPLPPLPNQDPILNGFSQELPVPAIHVTTKGPPLQMESAPPQPPPRNYNSQYRTQFHSRQSSEEILDSRHAASVSSPPAGKQPQTSPPGVPPSSPRPAIPARLTRQLTGSERSAAASHSNSTATDQSLLDLADELGGGNSAASLHSRRSQEGARLGRPGSGRGSGRSQDRGGVSVFFFIGTKCVICHIEKIVEPESLKYFHFSIFILAFLC